jgi:hypothetical protein
MPTATDSKTYRMGQDTIVVEVENSTMRFAWRIIVNGDASRWSRHYDGVLMHKGYCIATAYWEGTFPEFIPFKIATAEEEVHPRAGIPGQGPGHGLHRQDHERGEA